MYHANLQISTSISRFDNLSRTSLRRHPFSFPLLRFVAFFFASRSLRFLISTDLETRFDIFFFFIKSCPFYIFNRQRRERRGQRQDGHGRSSIRHRKRYIGVTQKNNERKEKKNCRRKRKGKPNVPL